MIGAILGGATALASGISAIVNFQQAQQRDKDAEAKARNIMGMQETNKMAALQAQDVASLSRQQTAQQTAGATQAVQGMGPEGAAQIANIYQAGREAEAQTAQKQAQINFDVEAAKAQAAQNLEFRNVSAQRELALQELQDTRQAAADKRAAGIAGIEGAFAGLGMAAEDIIGMSNPYARLSGAEKAKLGIG
jgi:hypothetical protein